MTTTAGIRSVAFALAAEWITENVRYGRVSESDHVLSMPEPSVIAVENYLTKELVPALRSGRFRFAGNDERRPS